MPKQYVLFGRPVPRIGSRRLSLLLVGLSVFAVFSLLFTLPSAVPTGSSLRQADNRFGLPRSFSSPWKSPFMQSFNPFRQLSHPPPRQANDTDGDSSWYPNMKWLSIPFSSSVTFEENRSLLPMLPERPPIYCYYDNTLDLDAASREAESAVLLTWRRAWWARGFRPIILSPAEAMNNPLYEVVQAVDMDPTLKSDMMRWLAWENMGGGLLARYLLFPMAAHDDPLLNFLRRGQYPALTRWTDLEDGLIAGSKTDVAVALKLAMSGAKKTKTAKSVLAALQTDADNDPFTIDPAPDSLALYSSSTLRKKYAKVSEAISTDRADGLRQLNQLVTAHLHLTWLGRFTHGVAVVKPLPEHTTHMIAPAYELAMRLTRCPDTPLPASCPPNNPECAPCVATQPRRIFTPWRYYNSSTVYTIGTVPHPFTTAALSQLRSDIDVPWIRRKSDRDLWLAALTRNLVNAGASAGPRVLFFKEAVASEAGAARSLWLTAEAEALPADHLDWHFGFRVPSEGNWVDVGRRQTPEPEPDPIDGPVATPEDLAREPPLLLRAREVVNARGGPDAVVRNAAEAWNLGDSEAWRFARAYLAREMVERRKFEDEEAKYADGVGSEKGRHAASSAWARWLDPKDKASLEDKD